MSGPVIEGQVEIKVPASGQGGGKSNGAVKKVCQACQENCQHVYMIYTFSKELLQYTLEFYTS